MNGAYAHWALAIKCLPKYFTVVHLLALLNHDWVALEVMMMALLLTLLESLVRISSVLSAQRDYHCWNEYLRDSSHFQLNTCCQQMEQNPVKSKPTCPWVLPCLCLQGRSPAAESVSLAIIACTAWRSTRRGAALKQSLKAVGIKGTSCLISLVEWLWALYDAWAPGKPSHD